MSTPTYPLDFSAIRAAFAQAIEQATGLVAIVEQPEDQDNPRPPLPYMSYLITSPAAKSGDDSKDYDASTGLVNSGGQRKMTAEFNCYGLTNANASPPVYGHEQAYSLMGLWQTALDSVPVQEMLRAAGIAVWVIGNVADLSQLLNTGTEGRANLEVTFGVAMNLEQDFGCIETVTVDGQITTDQGNLVDTDTVVTKP